jgi:hypothetical protein
MSKSSLVLVAGILFLTACSESGMGPTGPQAVESPRQLAPRSPCTTSDTLSQPLTGQPALKLVTLQEECRPTI